MKFKSQCNAMSRAMSWLTICAAALAVIPACMTASEPDEGTLDDSIAEGSLALSSEGEVCLPALGASQDAVLSMSTPYYNDGTGAELVVGTLDGDLLSSVIQFDTSDVPSGATVVSASMTLYETYANIASIGVYRVTQSWSELTVTSTSLGDDYTGEGSVDFSADTTGAHQIPIPEIAQAWLDDDNHGLLLAVPYDEFSTGGKFSSRESPNVDQRPSLSICYVTCNDGIQNGEETGVDCGGSRCAACPTCDDGVQNGGETGVDCGGNCAACPPLCGNGVKEAGEQCDGADVGVQCVLGVALCTSSCNLLLNICVGPH